MSVYTYRILEYLSENTDGSVWKVSDLPDASQNKGKVYRINIYKLEPGEHRYYRSTENQYGWYWCGMDSVSKQWHHVKWYTVLGQRKFIIPGEEKMLAYQNDHTYVATAPNGETVKFLENTYWVNNGGHVRDDYVSENGFGDARFCNRGIPSDASESVLEEVKNHDYCWGKTYVNMSEWESELGTLLDRFKETMKKHYRDERLESVDDKVTELLDLYKKDNPPRRAGKSHKKKDEEDDYNDFADVYEDEIWKIINVADEISICDNLFDEFVPSSVRVLDRRVIYFMG